MRRSERLLVLVLTRRCDRRCGFCPQAFEESDMAESVLDAALEGLLPRLAAPARVKLFGGEPLLRPDLVARALDLVAARAPGTPVELPTHGGGLAAAAAALAGRDGLEVFVSRPDPRAARLAGVVHNFLIPPGEAPERTARRLLDARRAGFTRFNVLPAYFAAWTPPQLGRLDEAFARLAGIVARLAAAGRPVEIVNLERAGSTPLYNDGLVVDVDGEVYSSNLVLTAAAAPRRGLLRLGRVQEPGRLAARPPSDAARVLEESFPPEVLAATRAADAALTRFCRGLEGAGVRPGTRGCGARPSAGLRSARPAPRGRRRRPCPTARRRSR